MMYAIHLLMNHEAVQCTVSEWNIIYIGSIDLWQ